MNAKDTGATSEYRRDRYAKAERSFLLFAGIAGSISCALFIVGFLWFGFLYRGPYERHYAAWRTIVAALPFAALGYEAVKLAVEAYHGKVLD
jgi:hypothetical protein